MKVKRNDHEATQSHAVPDVIKKKKTIFSGNLKQRSTESRITTKICSEAPMRNSALRNCDTYHQTFGLLWTKIIFDSFG